MPTTLKVNLSAVGNGCDQDTTPAGQFPHNGWYVFLYTCDGKPFVHAGKEYGPFPVDHGYLEIKDVPRGRYLLFAIVNPVAGSTPIPGGEVIFYSNFASHYAVVDVCDCCDDICVTLYNSGWHYCVSVIILWFELLMKQGAMDAALARPAVDALRRAKEGAGKTMKGDANLIQHIERLTAGFAAEGPEDE